MSRQKFPDGYVARCQCGAVLGCMDYDRTPKEESGRTLGNWLRQGLTVEPRWGAWRETIGSCTCDEPSTPSPFCDRGTTISQNIPRDLGVGTYIDHRLPEGTLEVWQGGKRIGRIENIGRR